MPQYHDKSYFKKEIYEAVYVNGNDVDVTVEIDAGICEPGKVDDEYEQIVISLVEMGIDILIDYEDLVEIVYRIKEERENGKDDN